MLEIESKIYTQKLSELIKTDIGKYVLIKNENIIGTYESIGDALKSGYEKFKDQPFFVKKITQIEQSLSFANTFLFK